MWKLFITIILKKNKPQGIKLKEMQQNKIEFQLGIRNSLFNFGYVPEVIEKSGRNWIKGK